MSFLDDLKLYLDNLSCKYCVNEPLSRHTSFKIGGNANILIKPQSKEVIKDTIIYLKNNNIPYFILGKGSNILFSDDGFKGVIIKIDSDFSEIKLIDDTTIEASAGTSLTQLCIFAQKNSLTGLEFAYGIPGTLGGAIYMNAGAYGGEIKDVLQTVLSIDNTGIELKNSINELEMGYRKSKFSNSNNCILSAVIKLEKGDSLAIKQKMDETLAKRKDKQPLEYPSAGSTFKRPEGTFAGLLIEQSGLKGYSIGGAQVSEKHAGFIINKDRATSKDVLSLIEHVKNTVLEKTGYLLECEVKIIG